MIDDEEQQNWLSLLGELGSGSQPEILSQSLTSIPDEAYLFIDTSVQDNAKEDYSNSFANSSEVGYGPLFDGKTRTRGDSSQEINEETDETEINYESRNRASDTEVQARKDAEMIHDDNLGEISSWKQENTSRKVWNYDDGKLNTLIPTTAHSKTSRLQSKSKFTMDPSILALVEEEISFGGSKATAGSSKAVQWTRDWDQPLQDTTIAYTPSLTSLSNKHRYLNRSLNSYPSVRRDHVEVEDSPPPRRDLTEEDREEEEKKEQAQEEVAVVNYRVNVGGPSSSLAADPSSSLSNPINNHVLVSLATSVAASSLSYLTSLTSRLLFRPSSSSSTSSMGPAATATSTTLIAYPPASVAQHQVLVYLSLLQNGSSFVAGRITALAQDYLVTPTLGQDDPDLRYRLTARQGLGSIQTDTGYWSDVSQRLLYSSLSYRDRQLLQETRDKDRPRPRQRKGKGKKASATIATEVLVKKEQEDWQAQQAKVVGLINHMSIPGLGLQLADQQPQQSVQAQGAMVKYDVAGNSKGSSSNKEQRLIEMALPSLPSSAVATSALAPPAAIEGNYSSSSSNSLTPRRRGHLVNHQAQAEAEELALEDDQYQLARYLVPPAFQLGSSCSTCSAYFLALAGIYRHHCRHCGGSFCSQHSSQQRCIPRLGFFYPVRVCDLCASRLDLTARLDRLLWKDGRLTAYLQGQLLPYDSSSSIDRGLDKVGRVVDASLFMAKQTLFMNYPTKLLLETICILQKYGLTGFAGLLLQQDFMESIEMLRQTVGWDTWFGLRYMHEVSACVYYKLAIDRGLRGCNPDGEFVSHSFACVEIDGYRCQESEDRAIQLGLRYAPLALTIVYEEQAADMQRLAALQGLDLLYTNCEADGYRPSRSYSNLQQRQQGGQGQGQGQGQGDSSKGKAEQEHEMNWTEGSLGCGYAVFTTSSKEEKNKKKEVMIAIRGTVSIQDVVTDIRANPIAFPPDRATIRYLLTGAWDRPQQAPQPSSYRPQQLERLDETTGSYACEGMARAACWLLAELGPGLLRLIDEGYSITLTGHSLGAAIANLLALLLLYAEIPGLPTANAAVSSSASSHSRLQVVSYGCPSCLSSTLAAVLLPYSLSFIHHDDVIPRLTSQSIRSLLKEVALFRNQVFRHLEQDWEDVLQRAYEIWAPRYRGKGREEGGGEQGKDDDDVKEGEEEEEEDEGGDQKQQVVMMRPPYFPHHEAATATANGKAVYSGLQHLVDEDKRSSSSLLQALPEAADVGGGQQQQQQQQLYLIPDETLLLPLNLPGEIHHTYYYRGQYRLAQVDRSFPVLRRIEIQGHIFDDHRCQSMINALLEVRAVRRLPSQSSRPPLWQPYDSSPVCACCSASFTWHSTFRGQPNEYRERYNCRMCGHLVCGPCSREKRAIPRYGMIFPRRICDACLLQGEYAQMG